MALWKASLIAAVGLMAAGSVTPASAGALVATTPALASDDLARGEAAGLHLVTDRGSWIKPKSKSRYGYDRRHRHFDDHHHHRKHFAKKKKRKFYRRGYRRGFDRGYDEGYYEGRRHSYYDRRRHHHYYERRLPDYGFRGGIYFGDGYYQGGGFRFRY